MKHDFTFSLRSIKSHPWFCLAIITTLALGIGINTTVFTLANAVLFKPVPVPNGERLLSVRGQNLTNANNGFMGISHPDFVELKNQVTTFEYLEAVNYYQRVISEEGNPPERVNVAKISSGVFEMVQAQPILGQDFESVDGVFATANAVMLSYDLWQSRYAGDPDVIGRSVTISGNLAEIVGVMPEGFKFPNNENIWMPLIAEGNFDDRSNRWIQPYGMLKKGVTQQEASVELALIAQRLEEAYPDTNKDITITALTFHEQFNGGEIRILFLTMMGAVGFVLLIACANVANMMLSRALTRSYETSVRSALGASRWQLVRQFLVESIVLSALGGLLGLAITATGVYFFDEATAAIRPYWIEFTMDYRVLFYFSVISILSGIIFGLMPALRASRVDLNSAMKDGARSSGSASKGRLTGALVVFQFSMTAVLLCGAGMMVRGFFIAQSQNDFVPVEELFTARVNLPEGEGERYEDEDDRRIFYETLIERLEALPSVTQVSAAMSLPGMGSGRRPIEIDGRPVVDENEVPQAGFLVQTKDFFSTIGVTIHEGRGFLDTDDQNGQKVALASLEFIATHWPGESGIGKRFRFLGEEGEPWLTIVGIVGNLNQQPRNADAPPMVFIPHRQRSFGGLALLVRTDADPLSLTLPIRKTVQELDSDLPLSDIRTMQQAIDSNLWFLKVFGTLFLSFAAIALLMASVGVYAVVAQGTAQRTREIGVRMALGATGSRVLRLILARGFRQLIIGLSIGLGISVFTNGLLANTIAGGVMPWDPIVLCSVCFLLFSIGIFACWLPARKAAALHPSIALRAE